MGELFAWSMGFFLVFGLPSLLGYGGNKGNNGSSNKYYDFKDYVDKKADEYNGDEK